MSNFSNDLSNEQYLAKYLDENFYPFCKTLIDNNYTTERFHDKRSQNNGIDLILKNENRNIYVDEKAQLDYLERALPTFAFELGTLNRDNNWRKGWLIDNKKKTDLYFLITGIHVKNKKNIKDGILKCKVTSVDRRKLRELLKKNGLTTKRLLELEESIRKQGKAANGRSKIAELAERREGNCNFSYTTKPSEKPINIVLYLDYLIRNEVAIDFGYF